MTHLAWLLSFGAGWLSLSEEILWVRFVGFVHHGVPHAFSLVLTLYLLGIALGAALGKRWCEGGRSVPSTAGMVLVAAGALDLALPGLLAALAKAESGPQTLAIAGLVLTSAGAKAAVFPLAHHLGSRLDGGGLGRSLARVYFLNIVGATIGPLVTGFVLLDHLAIDTVFVALGAASIGLGVWALRTAISRGRLLAVVLAGALASWGALASGGALGATGALEPATESDRDAAGGGMLAAYATRPGSAQIAAFVSNRHGVVHTVAAKDGDLVFGGNEYDGRTSIDLATNSSRLDRASLLAALHPAPHRVLVIGMSTGAWVRIVGSIGSVMHMDVVEINPGYLEVVQRYPGLRPTLTDPRIAVHIDDGRRWLKRHPQARYDLVVINTTQHWRANSTNLLSHQFLAEVRGHLLPGGIVAFNATGLPDCLHTAGSVFRCAHRYWNFVYASDVDFAARKNAATLTAALAGLRLDGVALLPAGSAALASAVALMVAEPFVDRTRAAAMAGRTLEVIDDDAVQPEFRLGRGLRF
ncbi:MAG: hypothetical protein EXR79_13470 [Myxococcales bacterium]|nr:hypothetical protein [Myxococcales bacterium]